jgi:hypothetical protein
MPRGDSGHRSTVITGALRPLVDYFGGVTKMASTLEVSRRTVLRWGSGDTIPSDYMRGLMNSYARTIGVREPFTKEGRLRKA